MATAVLRNSSHGRLPGTCPPVIVLVIDDDEHFRNLARHSLESAGMLAIEAASVQRGLELMRDLAVDAVILDLVMPEEDGISGLRRIRAAQFGVKIIAVSGAYAWQSTLRASALLGAHATMPKAHLALLCPLLERLLGQAGGSQAGTA
jgi:DNA-binding response OmpR family regulator